MIFSIEYKPFFHSPPSADDSIMLCACVKRHTRNECYFAQGGECYFGTKVKKALIFVLFKMNLNYYYININIQYYKERLNLYRLFHNNIVDGCEQAL